MDKVLRWFLGNILMYGWLVVGAFSEGGEECHPAMTCGKCMTISPACSWCKDKDMTFEEPRCDFPANLHHNGCINVTQEISTTLVVTNKTLQDPVYSAGDAIEEEAVPIAPQTVNLTIRKGDKQTIDVRVRQVNDYPVDLYYLMDLSKSMQNDLDNLKTLGSELAKEMKKITRSFALGFGSYVDKPVAPYINIAPNRINNPCKRGKCGKPYSFRNEQPLSQNTRSFESKVKKAIVSSSLDRAEGTFDAMMQAAVCKDQIGWRNSSRKLLLVTTDAEFHAEGDGKLGRIIEPNDGNCHLIDNEYKDAHLYDYPSIGQINQKLTANNIITIFAISRVQDLYQEVTKMIEGAEYSELSENSDNIVDIVTNKYKEITGSIELTHNAKHGVELLITSDCKEGSEQVLPGTQPSCGNIHDGDEISFQVEVKATECVDQTFEIYPIGYEQRLTVNVKVPCKCACEDVPEINSTACSNGNGNQVCGICQCIPGRYGDNCQCTGDSEENEDQKSKEIFCKPNNATKVLCSGIGECICGRCQCNKPARQDEIVSGTFCECNNLACPKEDGEVCGGAERGECVCAADGRTNECRCRPGYTGTKCNCPTQKDTCRSRNGLICNAKGKCVCGKCVCDEGTKFSGSKCDECSTCRECDLHIGCVQCRFLNNTESLSTEECSMCLQVINTVTELPERNDTKETCIFSDQNKCSISFVYEKVSNGTIFIYVKEERDCAQPKAIVTEAKVHLLIIFIVLGIILIGLILILLFRLYTWYRDRIEYQQFLKEQGNTQWEKTQNPLYKSTTSTFQNPTFGK